MKNLLLFVLLLSFQFKVIAQCLPEGIFINSQSQVDNFAVDHPGCTEIEGSLRISGGTILNLNGLSQITKLGQDLEISMCTNLNSLAGLHNIDTIANNLTINNCYVTNLGLTALTFVGGSVSINDLTIGSFEGLNNLKAVGANCYFGYLMELTSFQGLNSLTSVGGNLTLPLQLNANDFQGLNSLSTIGGDFKFPINTTISNFQGLNNLKYVGGEFQPLKGSSFSSFEGLTSLESVKSSFFYWGLGNIQDFTGLESLKIIEGDFAKSSISTQFNNFTGLESLEEITGSFYFSQFSSFEGLSSLHKIGGDFDLSFYYGTLLGLEQLHTIGGDLWITPNSDYNNIFSLEGLNNLSNIGGILAIVDTHLTDLNGINNLKTIGSLNITLNKKLTNILALQNIYYIANYINITDNETLSDCAVDYLCSSPETSINHNAPGCNSIDEIPCSYLGIGGYTYYDANQNGIKDDFEYGISNQNILFNTTNHLSSQNGMYFQKCDSGAIYNISWQADPAWVLTSDSSSYTIQFIPNNPDSQNKNFGLNFSKNKHQATSNITAGTMRCNTSSPFYLRYQNTGSYVENGDFVFYYDPLCSFDKISLYNDAVVDTISRTITWPCYSFKPFETRDFILFLHMPDENSTGELMNFKTDIFYGDPLELLTRSSVLTEVRCSFDPNDKNVSPSGEQAEHYTLHDQKLTYTIRFQNTGNAEAIDIRILDTLDTNLDLSTMRVVNSSFPVVTTLDDNAVSFYFKNIWLPDSTHNEPASHGFVTYEVTPKAGLADYTRINNTAHIIFDSNPAIVTNTAFNLMVTTIPVGTQEVNKTPIFIRPNPASSTIEISALAGQKINAISIYDPIGRLLLTQKETIVNISNFPKGIYFVKVNIGGFTGIQKLVVE